MGFLMNADLRMALVTWRLYNFPSTKRENRTCRLILQKFPRTKKLNTPSDAQTKRREIITLAELLPRKGVGPQIKVATLQLQKGSFEHVFQSPVTREYKLSTFRQKP